MPKISIVKVDSPSSLWGRVVCSPGGEAQTFQHYNNLLLQMNIFYHEITHDLQKLKPKALEQGQVCVVYWTVKRVWCRAVVEMVITDSISSKARCLLVDYGERIVISSEHIRVAAQKFLELPFWVKKFQLANIKPTTLRVLVDEEKSKLMPSALWDSSATLHLHNLLQVSTQTEAVLVESTSDSASIELYLTVGKMKICVNDDLVAKKFAYYSREESDSGFQDEEDQIVTPSVSSTFRELMTLREPNESVATSNNTLEDSAAERLMKFLNPNTSHTPSNEAPSEEQDECQEKEMTASEQEECPVNAEAVQKSNQPEHISEAASSSSVQPPVDEQLCSSREAAACARLLEWLNPEPLNVNGNTTNLVLPSIVPNKSVVLVHSVVPVEPCSNLEDAPITDTCRWLLRRKQYVSPSPTDCYSWPAIARGCNTVVISHSAVQPLSYLPPLLTHIQLNSIFKLHTSTSGPIVVLLCPGWEKVQMINDLLAETNVARVLHPITVQLGVGKDEAKAVKIPENCLLLVTTPFSLVRLLSSHCFLFRRIYHMVLDEADRLFSFAPEQMATILQHFSKVVSSVEKASLPQQLVVIAKKWSDHMEGLIVDHMPQPCIVISIPEEAALYGNVQQVSVLTLQCSKMSALWGMLDVNPEVGQKTLIITNSCQEVEDVFKAVGNKSAFCLKTHEGLTHQLDFVTQQWKKDVGPATHVILVTTNECLKSLGIRDASCVIHYDFPSSPKLFGIRLFCMAKNFRNLSKQVCQPDSNKSICKGIKSVLLISEKNVHHVVGVLRFLGRTRTPLPPQLLSLAEGIHLAREDLKTSRPLCSYLKSFGSCRDNNVCPDRHRFIPQLDTSVLPSSGVIEVVPLYIKTASVYYGRVLWKEDTDFDMLCAELVSFYSDKKPGVKEVLTGGLYAVQEEDSFHRVKILSVPDRGESLFFSVLVRFIDVGKEKELKSYQILELPERFHLLPAQAVEFVVCRVKPSDAEIDWHPKVTRLISQKIQGLQHRACAVFSLGNTVFLDPMVRVSRVPGLKTSINEYSVQSEILNSGMGVSNHEHVHLLKTLCQETRHISEEAPSSQEVRIEAEEAVVTEAFRAAALLEFTAQHSEPVPPNTSEQRLSPTSPAAEATSLPCQSFISTDKESTTSQPTQQMDSFNPRVLWHQTSELVIVRVKLWNPECQSCHFTEDRVVYSGEVSGRPYRANLELHQHVTPERCCWEMKSNEPVLKLVKQQQTHWERLLKNKNIFVSYDMDYIDEEEGKTPSGLVFEENLVESNCYATLDSNSDSD